MEFLYDFIYSERGRYTLALWASPTITFWILNVFLYLIYHYNLFSQYKIQGTQKWPNESLVRKATVDTLINHLVARPITAYYFYGLHKYFGGADWSMNAPLPSLPTILYSFVVYMIVNDTLFYWSHRALHHPSVYKRFHKQHHEFHVSLGITTEYASPFESVFSNTIPTVLGPLIMGSHPTLLWMWLVFREIETVDAHCGYVFPFSPMRPFPFNGPQRHDYHHSNNTGNFGSFFTFWDKLMGTDAYGLALKAGKIKRDQF